MGQGEEHMTQDEIIEMAKQVGLWPAVTDIFLKELEAFAKLVAQHERNEIIQILEDSTGYVQMDLIRERGQT
jgi:hypothetical protein